MLYFNGKEIIGIQHIKKGIQAVYHLGVIVWQGIKSCYGTGAWLNDMPWSNDDAWNNG